MDPLPDTGNQPLSVKSSSVLHAAINNVGGSL